MAPSEKHETLTLSVPAHAKDRLEELAAQHGLIWGNKGSASKLIGAIAEGRLTVSEPGYLSDPVLAALRLAIRFLGEHDRMAEAEALGNWLLAQPRLDAEAERWLIEHPASPDALLEEGMAHHVARRQPFKVVYDSQKGHQTIYTVIAGHVAYHEGRAYLEACALEGETDSKEVPGLRQNRTFRLDRIRKVVPVSGDHAWQDEVPMVEVELAITGESAVRYEPHPDDVADELTPATPKKPALRRISRRIRSSWWFTREILKSGPDFEVVAPLPVRERVRAEIEKMAKRYAE